MELFEGDHQKCRQLDEKIARRWAMTNAFPVSGQTYSRKLDSQMLNLLSGIAQSAAKFSNDIRLLQHLKEVEEPFEKGQIGLFRHGVQAQPHAQRAHRLPGAVLSSRTR